MKRILLITTYDSFFKAGLLVAKNINNSTIDVFVHEGMEGTELSQNQLNELGMSEKNITTFHIDSYFKHRMYENYDVVVLSVGNSLLNRFYKLQYEFYRKQMELVKPPILITLFPGVIFGDRASLMARMLSDIVLYLCRYDYNKGELIKKQYGFKCISVLYGFSELVADSCNQDAVNKKIYFIDQVIIPALKEERLLIIERLITLAKQNPLEQFVILPRVGEGERTVHKDPYPYRVLINEFENVPGNLSVERISISQALSNMKLCISMSSTVVFEAMTLGIPIYIIRDFGIKPEFANSIFVNSGVMGKLLDLDIQNLPEPNKNWMSTYYYCSKQGEILNTVLNNHKIVDHPYDIYREQIKMMAPFQKRLLRKILKLLKNPILFFRDITFFARLNK